MKDSVIYRIRILPTLIFNYKIMKAKKFFIYARKSSESEERQVQSIDDQLKIMRNKAKMM